MVPTTVMPIEARFRGMGSDVHVVVVDGSPDHLRAARRGSTSSNRDGAAFARTARSPGSIRPAVNRSRCRPTRGRRSPLRWRPGARPTGASTRRCSPRSSRSATTATSRASSAKSRARRPTRHRQGSRPPAPPASPSTTRPARSRSRSAPGSTSAGSARASPPIWWSSSCSEAAPEVRASTSAAMCGPPEHRRVTPAGSSRSSTFADALLALGRRRDRNELLAPTAVGARRCSVPPPPGSVPGVPAFTGVLAVTVVAATAATAEVLTKAVFVAGVEPGAELVEQAGATGLIVTESATRSDRSAGSRNTCGELAGLVVHRPRGGLVGWALATASVLFGLLLSGRITRTPKPAWVLDLHRFLGGLTVVFVGVHLLGLWLDSYVHFGPSELFLPFASSWKPGAVAWGSSRSTCWSPSRSRRSCSVDCRDASGTPCTSPASVCSRSRRCMR